MTVSLILESAALKLEDLSKAAKALQRQLDEHFGPAWNVHATLEVVSPTAAPTSGSWWLRVVDDDGQAGADGIHELNPSGLPQGIVYVKKKGRTLDEWTITASHELLEMLADPHVTLCVRDGQNPNRLFALEVCDPCDGKKGSYDIDGVAVSNFVLPAWFEAGPVNGQLDFCGQATTPMTPVRGGYIGVCDTTEDAWKQIDSQGKSIPGAPPRGSRRSRRGIEKADHRPSEPILPRGSMHIPNRVEHEIDDFVTWLEKQTIDQSLTAERKAELLETLKVARAHLAQVRAHPLGSIEGDARGERALSLVLGTRPAVLVAGKDIWNFHQYENLDPRWFTTMVHSLFDSKVPFVTRPRVIDIPDKVSFCIAGDWGTGNASSQTIMQQMVKQAADYTVHLGDVYYAGTPEQEQSNFVIPWASGSAGSFTLNSNHEMYSGAHGYYKVALAHPKFALQGGCSYFALRNKNWLIVGLDTAYFAAAPLYNDGHLDAGQLGFLKQVVAGNPMPDGSRRKLMLLTHHQPMEFDGKTNALWDAVKGALGDGPDYWYWGHVHAPAVMKPVTMGKTTLQGRCVGHGGVPYEAEPKTPKLAWTESGFAGDKSIPTRALNGFVELALDGSALAETFWGEDGSKRPTGL